MRLLFALATIVAMSLSTFQIQAQNSPVFEVTYINNSEGFDCPIYFDYVNPYYGIQRFHLDGNLNGPQGIGTLIVDYSVADPYISQMSVPFNNLGSSYEITYTICCETKVYRITILISPQVLPNAGSITVEITRLHDLACEGEPNG